MMSAMVTNIDEQGVTIKIGGAERHIPARTVLWAAGVRASSLGKVLASRAGAQLDKAGRVIVEPDLSVPGHPEIHDRRPGDDAPGRQAVAGRGAGRDAAGPLCGSSIQKKLRRQAVAPFHYFNKGNLATIGRNRAVAELEETPHLGFPGLVRVGFRTSDVYSGVREPCAGAGGMGVQLHHPGIVGARLIGPNEKP